MRKALLAAILFALAPPANAQNEPDTFRLEDGADVTSTVPGSAGFADIRTATVIWNETQISVAFEVEGPLDPSLAVFPYFADYWLEFKFRGESFRLSGSYAKNPAQPVDSGGILSRGPQLWRLSEDLWAPILATTGTADTLAWWVSWDGVRTSSEEFPNPGQAIELASVGSHWDTTSAAVHDGGDEQTMQASDSASFPAGSLAIVPGALSRLIISTAQQVRFSNGEATTFHWPVEIRNGLTAAVDIDVTSSAPADINPEHTGALHLDVGETKTIQVYVPVPFTHQHGSDLVVNMAFEGAGERAEYPLRVHYPSIPQPAGHHPTLWLHGAVSNSDEGTTVPGAAWMNAAAEDPAASARTLTGIVTSCLGEERFSRAWWFPLTPALRIGLDADMKGEGMLHGTFVEQRVRTGGTLYSSLELFRPAELRSDRDWNVPFQPDEWTASVVIGESTGPGATLDFELPVRIRPELDRLDPTTQQNLALRLVYCVPIDDVIAARGILSLGGIRAEARLELPLHEFHDVIQLGTQAIPMTTDEPNVRAAPGSIVNWDVNVDAPEGRAVRVFAVGSYMELVEVPGPTVFNGPGVATATLRVPEDARPGDLLEFVLVSEAKTDASLAGGIRLSVTVDPQASVLDGRAPGAEAPAASLALALAAMAAALAARRRP